MKRSAYTYELDPTTVKIVGLDTPADLTDPLYEPERAEREIPPDEVEAAYHHGVPGVVEVLKRDPDLFVVTGRQRTKALRKANEQRIKDGLEPHLLRVILVDSKEKPLDLMGRVVLENALQTPLTPLQKAGWVKRLKEAGKSAKEIASLFGVTEQSIRDWDVLANANPKVQAAVSKGKISAYNAVQIERKAKGDPDKVKERLAKALEAKEPSSVGGKPAVPKTKNVSKSLAKEMANEDPEQLQDGAEILDEQFLRGLQFAFVLISSAECGREVKGFKAAAARAQRRLS